MARITTSPANLNKRIEIQSFTSVSDGMGGTTDTWSTAHNVWAAIWPVSANDVIAANSLTMMVNYRIRIRYCSGCVSSKDRIKWGSKYFSIVSILNPNEANEWLDLMCNEATA